MDDYTREMMDLKTLVTRTLEKKGVLAKIRAELRASVFAAIEEEDRVIENNEGLPPALLGSCNDRARQLHASPSGRLLSALICEYLDWAQLNHTLKVYQPECNLAKDSWKTEVCDFSSNNVYDLNRNGDNRPLLLDVLEGFLKFENMTQVMGGNSWRESETESSSSLDSRNLPRISSASDSLPPQQRPVSASQASGAATSGYRKDEYNWRYDSEDVPEEVMRASTALENLQLDRKTRNLTSSWSLSLGLETTPVPIPASPQFSVPLSSTMEARILQSSSSASCFSSLDTVNRYRFSSVSSPKPLSVSFTQMMRTRTSVSRVLSMSKKDDGTDSLTYRDSGVDIDAGTELVKRIAKMAPGIGGFGGLFPLGDDYLVAGTDGVGTKLKLAFETGIHDTIGIDLVAMSVNDIITSGAKPLFFLDYFATSRLDVDLAEKVIKGIVEGCRQSECALLGGETAEMPDFYAEGEYDLSGFAVGIVKKKSVINGKNIVAGDVLIGLPSSGVHSNGFSLVRRVLARSNLSLNDALPGGSSTLGEALMAPTVIYVKQVLDIISRGGVKGIAHITGGGFTDNIPRVFPDGLGAVIHTDAWELPPLFKWIQQSGRIEDSEMRRTFNLGIGMVMVVSPEAASRILQEAKNGDYVAYHIGEVINGEGVSYQ